MLLVTALVWPWPQLGPRFWGCTAACALFELTANLCLVAAFRTVPFSRAVVMHKLMLAMAPFVGAVWFGEIPTRQAVVGILLCAGGAVLLNVVGRPAGRLRLDRGIAFALGSAVSVVLASYFLKQGTQAFVADNGDLPHDRATFWRRCTRWCTPRGCRRWCSGCGSGCAHRSSSASWRTHCSAW